MQLIDIIPNLTEENNELEYKGILNRDNTLSWLKTVDGFANAEGGVFYVGVEDKTLKLIGYDQKSLDGEKLFFHNELSNHFSIMPSYFIETIPYKINNSIRYIIKITINESSKKPLILRHQGMPMIYVRRDGFTSPATEEEIRNMVLNSDFPSFDKGLTDIDFERKDFSKYFAFCKERTNKDIKIKELESISFIKDGKLTNGAYLFSDNYNGDKTKVVCSLYKGVTRGDDIIISSNEFKGNLIDCYHFITDFISMRTNHKIIKKEDRRVDIYSYPERAVFEAVINALAHRDYLLNGTQINVDIYLNRLVISSPGSIFEGDGNIKPTYDLTSYSSKRRNEVISNAFILAKAMEAKGTGLEKISEEYRAYDKSHQPYIYCKNNSFNIVLPDLTNDYGVNIENESIYVIDKINNPTRFDISVLSYCYLAKRSMKEITEHIGVSNSTFFKSTVIDNLVSQDYLIVHKLGNKYCYITNEEKVKIR